ncbi:MAG: MmgE/PrpD family protein [archaeon]
MTETAYTRDWERTVNDFLETSVPTEIHEHGHRTVVDVLSAAVAGTTMPGIGELLAPDALPEGRASIPGSDRQVTPEHAALVTTAAAISQEVEEGHDRGGHAGASIVAGGLSTAEVEGLPGRDFVANVIKVYEITTRMEYALFAMKDRLNDAVPWLVRDPHSTWTTVGPALSTALALGASAEDLRETFRIAANLAVVSMHDPYVEGAPARNLTAGFSAQAGVTAARTGLAGVRGSKRAIEAVYDPLDALLGEGEFTKLFENLGEDWWITESYNKPYPSCRYTHPALDALRDIANIESVDPRDVDRIVVQTFENAAAMDHQDPTTPTSAKFSIPYVLGRYLVSGGVSLQHFLEDVVREPAVLDLAKTVTVDAEARFEAEFPDSWGAAVRVETTDGRVLTGDRAYPSGDHRDPMTEEDFEKRTRDLLAWGLDDGVDEAAAALFDLPNRSMDSVARSLRE